ncbi:MAG: hypothetical protein ACLUDG_00995 [Butyricicoccus sp.]
MKNFLKLFCCLISIIICIPMIVGCSGMLEDSTDTLQTHEEELYEFIADESLAQYLDEEVYQRVISESLGADLPDIPFFNKNIVCMLNYNGLLIFDNKTGQLKDAIDIQKMDFGTTQGDSAIIVRGNDDFITIFASNHTDGYVYEIASSQLGKMNDDDNMFYTEMKNPEKEHIDLLGLPELDDTAERCVVESIDGIAVCDIPLNDLSKINFRIYSADYKIINEFSISK